MLATGSQELNKLSVVESENDVGNLNLSGSDVVLALSPLLFLDLVELLGENLLELPLDVGLEALTNGDVALAGLVTGVDVALKELPCLLGDLELASVIAWGDGLHVPLNLVKVTRALEMEEHNQVDADCEHSEARYDDSLAALGFELLTSLDALVLHEQLRVRL